MEKKRVEVMVRGGGSPESAGPFLSFFSVTSVISVVHSRKSPKRTMEGI